MSSFNRLIDSLNHQNSSLAFEADADENGVGWHKTLGMEIAS
jgi:hypothetical protein